MGENLQYKKRKKHKASSVLSVFSDCFFVQFSSPGFYFFFELKTRWVFFFGKIWVFQPQVPQLMGQCYESVFRDKRVIVRVKWVRNRFDGSHVDDDGRLIAPKTPHTFQGRACPISLVHQHTRKGIWECISWNPRKAANFLDISRSPYKKDVPKGDQHIRIRSG